MACAQCWINYLKYRLLHCDGDGDGDDDDDDEDVLLQVLHGAQARARGQADGRPGGLQEVLPAVE